MKDVSSIHESICPNHQSRDVQLSLDGVQECRSNSVSLDVYSVKIEGCRNIYPLKIVRPINRFKLDYKPQLQDVLENLAQANFCLRCFIGDNPKRAIVREALNHASYYGCEYCTSKAERYAGDTIKFNEEKKRNNLQIKKFEKQIHELRNTAGSTADMKRRDREIEVLSNLIEELKKKNVKKSNNHCVWPSSTINGPSRTVEEIRAIVEMLNEEDRSQLSADILKGIVGKSLLLDVPGFEFVKSIPAEYMHTGCLGVVKRLKIVNKKYEMLFS